MAKPDKLPMVDPRTPDVYGTILRVAALVRKERSADNALQWSEAKEKRRQWAALLREKDLSKELSENGATGLERPQD